LPKTPSSILITVPEQESVPIQSTVSNAESLKGHESLLSKDQAAEQKARSDIEIKASEKDVAA